MKTFYLLPTILTIVFFVAIQNITAQDNGTCADFTTGDDYLGSGEHFRYDEFTIELWAYKSNWSVSSDEAIISCTQSGGFNITVEDDAGGDVIAFTYRNTSNSGYYKIYYPTTGLSAGWHHIVAAMSTADADIWVDGNNVDGEGSEISYNLNTHLLLGAEASGGSSPAGNYFNGYIDEVRLWVSYRDYSELYDWRYMAITFVHKPGYVSGLETYYKLDTDFENGWLDDASNNVGGYGIEYDLSNSAGTPTSASGIPLADFETEYDNQAEAIWPATGSNWSAASNGLSIQPGTPTVFRQNGCCVFAGTGASGSSTDDIPSSIKKRSDALWKIVFDQGDGSQDINLKFDLSTPGITEFYDPQLPLSSYKLLKRTGYAGEFVEVASANSASADNITFDGFTPDDEAFYALGLTSQISYTKQAITTSLDEVNAVDAGDIDGDGDTDFFATARGSGNSMTVAWFENDGAGTFTKHEISGTVVQSKSCKIADMDNDGDKDFVSISSSSGNGTGRIHWWENDGNQNFSKYDIDNDYFSPDDVFVADLDGDGYKDVFSCSVSSGGRIDWWKNSGDQLSGWPQTNITSSFDKPTSLSVADLDRDGDMDVIASGEAEDSTPDISWWENDGNENFVEHSIETNFDMATKIQVVDMDNDGDLDIAGTSLNTSASEGDLAWWENDGSANFTRHVIESDFSRTFRIFAADIEGDGDMDLLASTLENYFAVWYNDGEENFTKNTLTTNVFQPYAVHAADCDNDGDFDPVCIRRSYDEIAYWRHNGTPDKTVDFSDGNGFSPNIYLGQNDEVVGYFYLEADEIFSLASVKIRLDYGRYGFSDFRLWQSDDGFFDAGDDIQLGNPQADPGAAQTLTFDKSFANPVSTSGSYYFLTCDIAADGAGEIQGILVNNSSLGFSGGNLNGTINSAIMSDKVGFTTAPVSNINDISDISYYSAI